MSFFENIKYYALLGGCKMIGLLPDAFLYGPFKNLIYFILTGVTKYRVEVVRVNLRNSFPEKSEEDREKIEHDFYLHLAEVFVDTIKLVSITRKEIQERMEFADIEAHNAAVQGRSWFAAMSHFGSWELTINFSLLTENDVLAVYRPLSSATFNRFYQYARSRFGAKPVPMNQILKEVVKSRKPGAKPVAVALIADQTPPVHEIKHWFRFLGQDTPFFAGMEKMSLKFGIPIYFTYIRQSSPLHYKARFIEIFDGKEKVTENEITQRYVNYLEDMIRETPHLWMWSHRRWKHKNPNPLP